MSLRTVFYRASAALTALSVGLPLAQAQQDAPLLIPSRGIHLLESPNPGVQELPAMPGIQIVFAYFNLLWPWILGIAAGVAVLQALVGGVQIMFAGSNEKAEEGKARLIWSLAGLLLTFFAGFVLRLINGLFFI